MDKVKQYDLLSSAQYCANFELLRAINAIKKLDGYLQELGDDSNKDDLKAIALLLEQKHTAVSSLDIDRIVG